MVEEIKYPLVNVIIANHNYGKWLKGSIQSVLTQDYPNKMITVVDDGSTDDSISVIEEVCNTKFKEQNGIKLIETKVKNIPIVAVSIGPTATGPSNARNVAIELTKAAVDIYAILDADDEFLDGKLSRCISELMQQNMIGVVYADYIIEDPDGTKHIEYKEPFSRDRLVQECIVHSGSLILKQALLDTQDEFGYYDNQMRTCEDYDLWIRISERYMISHIPEPLTLVRVHSNNSTATVDNSIWQQNWNRISQKAQSRNQR